MQIDIRVNGRVFPLTSTLSAEDRRGLASTLLRGLPRQSTPPFGSGLTNSQKTFLEILKGCEPVKLKHIVKGIPIYVDSENYLRANVHVTRTLLKNGCIGIVGKKIGDIPQDEDICYFVRDYRISQDSDSEPYDEHKEDEPPANVSEAASDKVKPDEVVATNEETTTADQPSERVEADHHELPQEEKTEAA